MINGITELHMMKLDVLGIMDTIKVCTDYIVDGEITNQVPSNFNQIENVVYKEFSGWHNEDVSSDRSKYQLPTECSKYIDFIEDYLNIPITLISVGPERNQNIWVE